MLVYMYCCFRQSLTDKILLQLFDIHHPINTMAERYLFTTEGHVIPITSSLRSFDWEDDEDINTWKLSSRSRSSQNHRQLPRFSEPDVLAVPRNGTHSVVSIHS